MFKKMICLINEEKMQNCFEEKADGSIWQNRDEVFPSETEAERKGWTVDAIKIFLKTKPERCCKIR
jgi:hypothetical protein